MVGRGSRRVVEILIGVTVVVFVACVASPASAEALDGGAGTSTDNKVDESEPDGEAVDEPEEDDEGSVPDDDGTASTTDAEDDASGDEAGDTTADDTDASSSYDSGGSSDSGSSYDDGTSGSGDESFGSYHDDPYADDGDGFAGTSPQQGTSTSVAERPRASGDLAPGAALIDHRSPANGDAAGQLLPAPRPAESSAPPTSAEASTGVVAPAAAAPVASSTGPRIKSIPLTASSAVDVVRRAPRGVNLAAIAVVIWAIGTGLLVAAKRRRDLLIRLG